MDLTIPQSQIDAGLPERLAARLSAAREELFATPAPMPGLELMHRHSDIIDTGMARVFRAAVESLPEQSDRERVTASLALVATGGYGRRELAPYSDVDVTIISALEDDPMVDHVVREVFHILMDVILDRIGLKIGYAYRVLDDYETLDFVTKTSLMDSRAIAGNAEIVDTFTRDLRATLKADYLIAQSRSRPKTADIAAASLYAVEPNVKSGPGGLRDIHAAAWIGQALFDCGPDMVWKELVERRVLTSTHALWLGECRELVSAVRNALHISAGRQLDILSVERQPEVAALLGMTDEYELMHRYYTSAERLRWICSGLIEVLVSRRLPLDKMFYLTNGMLALGDKPIGLTRPGVILRAFRHAQECGIGFSPQLEEQTRAVIESDSSDIADKPSFAEFHAILEGENVYAALAHMVSLGVLQQLIPEFGELLHRVPSERVHEFTIGEHSLLVLRRLEEMRLEHDTLYSGIWGSVKDPAALYFAALMHDVGKGGEGDHPEVGAREAEIMAKRLGFPESSISVIRFLVANHQLMSETARRCDVRAISTVTEFTDKINDLHLLRMLFLISIADAVSVGQVSWGEMQKRFLEELYFVAEAGIMGPSEQNESERAERYRKRLKRELSLANLPEELVHEHCQVMPPTYLLNTKPERVAKHVEAVRSVRRGKPVVRMDEELMDRVTELTVVAPDKGPGLLSQVAGVLFALDVTVHSAAVFTRKTEEDTIAIDTLSIDYLRGRLPYMKRKEVERELLRVLTGEITVDELLKVRGKEAPAAPVKSVQLLGRHSETQSIIEVRADDVDGLLYSISRTMAGLGWNIQSARIATIGHQAVDTFAVSDRNGNRLPTAATAVLKQEFNGKES